MRSLSWLVRSSLAALALAAGCKSMAVRRLPDLLLPGDPLLHGQVRAALANVRATINIAAGPSQLARPDGYVYTVDVAQLLNYATLTADSALYWPLREFAIRKLLSDTVADPYTRGFVRWRYKDGSPPDASGTTEALRVAEALWAGARVFRDSAARTSSILMLHGYARHAYEEQGIWLIRNYFNFQNRSFASNSFLVDYDPDFVVLVARATGDSTLLDVAQRSAKLVVEAVSPSGLLYEVIQPEILTALPALTRPVFGPNDIISALNSCTVAERTTESNPAIGRRVLEFMRDHARENALYFYGRTGEPVKEDDLRLSPMACLLRLSLKLESGGDATHWAKEMVGLLGRMHPGGTTLDLYTTTEVLSALVAADRWMEGHP
jgi:hypothetical protein